MTYCEVSWMKGYVILDAQARKIISDGHLLPNFREVFICLLWVVGNTVRRELEVSGLMLVEKMDLKPWTFG